MQELTIIILTYNSAQVIEKCLRSLNFSKYKVVVVDNASKDNSLELVEKNFPQVEIIRLNKNIGYGRGNNVALNKVDTKFALILNPDAAIAEKDIEISLEVLRGDPKAAMVGPLVLDGLAPSNDDRLYKLKEIQNLVCEKINDNFFAVKFLVGAALFVKIELMKKIGFFDEKIFLFYEDDELSYRVIKNGYKNILASNAEAFHLCGKSSGSSVKVISKKSWHMSWSKLYWKKLRYGNFASTRSAIRLTAAYFIKMLCFALRMDKKKFIHNFSAMNGAFSFLIGREAFNKKGDSRG